ncbi:MAG: alpha/beta fold hydrolase [Lawsonella sp.]
MPALSELFPAPTTPAVQNVAPDRQPSATPDPVFVFPHAGGSPRFFHAWRPYWQSGAVWGVTYPGRDARMGEPAAASIQEMAADIARECVQLVKAGKIRHRLRLFGHSMGALVAYEVAQWLQRYRATWDPDRRVTVQLMVSGHNSPEIALPPTYVNVHDKPDAELVGELTRVDPRNAEIFAIPELAQLLLPYTREDYRLVETYRHVGEGLPIDEVLVVAGSRDPDCFRAGLQGWQRYATRWLGIHTFPGGHFYLAESPEVVPELVMSVTSLYVKQCT